MRFRRSLVTLVAVLGLTGTARAADPPTYTIDPHATDPAILDTPSPVPGTRGQHLVWLPPAGHAVGRLLVFLPTGGPTNLPSEFTELGTVARRLGYHAVFLAYRNEAPIAAPAPAGCGPSADPKDSPAGCALGIRTEILDGSDASPLVSIDPANSIDNRVNKVLQYLARVHPADGWANFITAGGQIRWDEAVLAGSSLGAGEAAILAARDKVHRVALLHGWVDASHGWVKLDATPSKSYFTLIHARDNFFTRTCPAYEALKLVAACPLVNPPLIENQQPPFNTQVHVFNLTPGSTMGTGDIFHQSTSRDGWIARESDLSPSHHLVNAWRSILGDKDADTFLDEADNCPAVANADQTDSDHNGIGDACGPTFATGTATGTVPATLALTLGAPVALGAFVPGVDRTYEGSTTATVISSAGDATLAVADPTGTGRLVNGGFSLGEPLQGLGVLRTYAAPISNDVVTVTFRQHIAATQALRTGVYAKTLTFTLSTTTP